MNHTNHNAAMHTEPDYGIDAPSVMRNLFLFGGLCLVLAFALPRQVYLGPVTVNSRASFLWPAGFLLGEGLLFLLYVKWASFIIATSYLGCMSGGETNECWTWGVGVACCW